MYWQVVLSGNGGHGLGLAGELLARAAGLQRGLYAVQTQSYGARARGGCSQSTVIISSQEILYPFVEQPDLLLALSQRGYERNYPLMRGGLVVYDQEAVRVGTRGGQAVEYKGYNLLRAAREIGDEIFVSVLSLGIITALTGKIGPEDMEEILRERISGPRQEQNLAAYHQGLATGKV
ncbi:MAG: hypothetical protein D9V47_06730 [Clostridia bacterium]|nr:MAG: hypothetical protein D9V47_06730 [Clostridia bacterium]